HQVDERKAPSARRQQMQTGPGRRDHGNGPAGKINRVAADQYQPEARKRRTSRHRAAQDDHREPSLQHCWLSGCLMVVRSCSRPKARSSWPLVQYVSSLAIAAEQSLLAQSQDAWTACGNCADAVVLRNSSHRLSARTKSSTSRLALSANNVKKSAADTQLARPAAVVCTTSTPAWGARRKKKKSFATPNSLIRMENRMPAALAVTPVQAARCSARSSARCAGSAICLASRV